MSLVAPKVDATTKLNRKDAKALRFFLIFFVHFLVSVSQNSPDRVKNRAFDTSKTKSFIVSGGYGFPNFFSALNYNSNYSNIGSDFLVIKDLGSFFLKGELYDPETGTSLGATVFYSQQYCENHRQSHLSKIDTFNYKDLGIGLRFNYYFLRRTHFHSYVGLGIGAEIPLKTFSFPAYGELVLGFRYMPTKNAGIYLEIGPSKVLAQTGLSFCF